MGRHSTQGGGGREGQGDDIPGITRPPAGPPEPGQAPGRGTGRRRRGVEHGITAGSPDPAPFPPPAVPEQGPAAQARRHPEYQEHAAWGAPDGWSAPPGGRVAARRTDLPDLDEPVGRGAFRSGPPAPTGTGTAGRRPGPGAGYGSGSLAGVGIPGQRSGPGRAGGPARQSGAAGLIPGPRQDFIDAFDSTPPVRPVPGPVEDGPHGPDGGEPGADPARRRAWNRTFTGIAAAAVVTVVVAGQVTGSGRGSRGDTTGDSGRSSPSQARAVPAGGSSASVSASGTRAPTYAQAMAEQYPLAPTLTLSGKFRTVPGGEKAPGKGKLLRFRVDVEQNLPLDADLFAQAVFKSLNDDRSWARRGARTFERVSTGKADIVVTLASPGTTADWCRKSGLDTVVDNVSCDSASTPRTMINAFRWAQGSDTYGPELMSAYREMLINHEVGHRLGYGHADCPKDGALAPVMMQQTKFLSTAGRTCRPNPWPYPNG